MLFCEVCVSVYACLSVCLHVCMPIFVCLHVCVSLWVYLFLCICLCASECLCVCVCLCVLVCVLICVLSACLSMSLCELYVCFCVCVYLFVYMSVCLSGYVAGPRVGAVLQGVTIMARVDQFVVMTSAALDNSELWSQAWGWSRLFCLLGWCCCSDASWAMVLTSLYGDTLHSSLHWLER